MNSDLSYFVPGYGISRHIMFSHIHFYLGPHADVRPYQFRGREGFLVTAPLILTKVRSSILHVLRIILAHVSSLEIALTTEHGADLQRHRAK